MDSLVLSFHIFVFSFNLNTHTGVQLQNKKQKMIWTAHKVIERESQAAKQTLSSFPYKVTINFRNGCRVAFLQSYNKKK